MAHLEINVNEAQSFLEGFSGKIFIRALHPDYDPGTGQPEHLKSKQFYGELRAVMKWLETTGRALNSGATPDNRYNIFYCANDPGQGRTTQFGDIKTLRVIYQDCDNKEVALIEPEIAGQQAHVVMETSPGKRQRIWHIEDIDAGRQRIIHERMSAMHHHDPSTQGPNRILRLPGFRNWKYEDGPLSHIVINRTLPRLTSAQVAADFAFEASDAYNNNVAAAANAIQRSGDKLQKIYDLEQERAKRLGQDADVTARTVAREARNIPAAQLLVSELLDHLSLIEPDMHRNDWRRVIAALHWMSNGAEWGRDIAEGWSSLGLEKWDEKTFLREWNGFDPDYGRPSTWLTIKRMTQQRRANKVTRGRRQSPMFKRLEELHGPSVDYREVSIEYPIREAGKEGLLRTSICRRNVEYLLQLEATEVYYDELQGEPVAVVNGAPPRVIDNRLLTELYSTAHSTGFQIDDGFLAKQIDAIASDTRFDPVSHYLNSLPAWDGVERLSTVFQRLMGAPDTQSVREVLPLMMMAMIRRTKQPGYKFDLMPILEGKQGLGKSSFFRILMPDATWFGEGPKMNEEAKRLLSALSGKLVVEFGELAGMSKQALGDVKKLITQQWDEYIANYARKKTRVPRRCVFVGTVNGLNYLRDLTGNRRFPIIPVTTELSYAKLQAERDQLWAEAMLEESVTEELRFTSQAEADCDIIRESRLDTHTETTAFMDQIRQFEKGWIATDVIWECLGFPHAERSKRTGQAQFVFKEVRDLMMSDGWEWGKPLKVRGKTVRAAMLRPDGNRPPEIICNGGILTVKDEEPKLNYENKSLEELLS